MRICRHENKKRIIKLEHYKVSKLLKDPIVSKFVIKNGSN